MFFNGVYRMKNPSRVVTKYHFFCLFFWLVSLLISNQSRVLDLVPSLFPLSVLLRVFVEFFYTRERQKYRTVVIIIGIQSIW